MSAAHLYLACLTLALISPQRALAQEDEREEERAHAHEHKKEHKAEHKPKAEPDSPSDDDETGEEREHEHKKEPDGKDNEQREHEHKKEHEPKHEHEGKGKHEAHPAHQGAKADRAKRAGKQKAAAHVSQAHKEFAVGAEGGWEASYGNAVTFTYFPWQIFGLTAGIGYNNSGVKIGAGAEFLLPLAESFGLRFTGDLVESLRKEGDVSLDASFTPAGSTTPQAIVATKHYELTPGVLFSTGLGGFYNLNPSIRFLAMVDYNLLMTGNEVTFSDKTTYDHNINVTNEPDFSAKFKEKAADVVRAGGFGGYVGVQYLF